MAGGQGKNSKKKGRNLKAPSKLRYDAENRQVKNKARKIIRHIKKYSDNLGGIVVADIKHADVRKTVNKFISGMK
jgi:orotidine-5'-phosphate decarboxylase